MHICFRGANHPSTHTGPQVLGIADGVGGWADSGVDPADYSRGLMKNCHEAALADETLSDPVEILKSGHEGMDEVRGSSTACVISLSDCHARTANLGDSGFLVYREGHVIYRSQEQTHYFNCPFQLGTNSQDRPQDADTARIELQKGDVLLMGTDGLFDNVFDQQLLSLLKHGIQSAGPGGALDADPQKIADNLADTAFHISQSTTGTTPFSHSCVIQGYDQHGGKPDDITVVVAIMG